MHLQLPNHNPKEVSADLAYAGIKFNCPLCHAEYVRQERDDTIEVESVTYAKKSIVPFLPARHEVVYVFTCPSCGGKADMGKRITDAIHTTDFLVYVPGEKEDEPKKIPIVIPVRFDPEICDWIVTPEGHELIDKTQQEHRK